MHPASFINDSSIIVDKVSVGDLQLYLFKDKEEARINPEHKPLPQEMIRNVDSKIPVGSMSQSTFPSYMSVTLARISQEIVPRDGTRSEMANFTIFVQMAPPSILASLSRMVPTSLFL